MKTVFTYGGSNPYSPTKEAMIELRQSEDKNGLFILFYGCEVTPGLTYARACTALGQAILHHLSCESIVNNEGERTMKPTLSINAPLSERLYFNPSSVSTEQVIDAMKAYEAILDAINGSVLDTMIEASDEPPDVSEAINDKVDSLIERADNPYEDFFDDCVGALNRYWPAASIEDETLRTVILDAIAKGDTD